MQDVIEQCHQFQIAGLGVFRALERLWDQADGCLEYLGLVVDHEGAQGGTQDGDQLEWKRLQDDGDIAAVKDVHAKDASHGDDVADDYEHGWGTGAVSVAEGSSSAKNGVD